jgi:hypothetical protein
MIISRLLKNAHPRRFPRPSSLRRTSEYAALLRISGALHLGIFEQPIKVDFFSSLLESAMNRSLTEKAAENGNFS